MIIGQQLGPFLIERELGSGAMGAVYLGKYVKNGAKVAVKVMAPGLVSNASALARFEREANILKQLSHPNIVRLYGVGKFQGTHYYAMEFIQGESLDKLMARRDRMSWEELVGLGTQLCDALQHAHDHGIIHRDLKPANLMMLPDGTLKLTDFGIAKDVDVTQLTAANSTLGTAAYMSPEQCRGERDLTPKSDLYSLGIVFYELLTGQKPFQAENAMDMFLLHVNEPPRRVSRAIPDIPVWLDTLIVQLMEKKPDQRPMNAKKVAEVLATIQEKIETHASAAVERSKARRGDMPKDKRDLSEEDREAMRSLAGKKPKKKKAAKNNNSRERILQAGGLLLLLCCVIGAIVWAMQPPSPDTLYKRAEELIKSGTADNYDRAREGPLREYLRRYGTINDSRTEQIKKWADDYDVARFEKLVDRHIAHVKLKKGFAVEAQGDAQKKAFEAAEQEYDGNRAEAVKLWQEVIKLEGQADLGILAQRRLDMLASIDKQTEVFARLLKEFQDTRIEPELAEIPAMAWQVFQMASLGDRIGAKRRNSILRELAAKDTANRFWQIYSAVIGRTLELGLIEKPQDEKDRVKRIDEVISEIQSGRVLLPSRMWAHQIATLYAKDTDLLKQVELAKELKAALDKQIGRK
jgi:serine/threonine-protein kinase